MALVWAAVGPLFSCGGIPPTGLAGAQLQLQVSNCSPGPQLPDASTDFQNCFCGKKGVGRVSQVDRMHLHFRTGKFHQKAVLKSARAQSVNRIFPENLQLHAAIRSSAQQGAVRFWRAGHSSQTTATVTGMKTSQQFSERKMASPDETWRSTTCPDETPRPGREFPAGIHAHPSSRIEPRPSVPSIQSPRPQSLSPAHNSQFRCLFVRFGAFHSPVSAAVLRTMLTTTTA